MRALALLLLLPLAVAEESEKDTLAGMDAEVRGDWVEAAQAFARASDAAPGDIRKATRLRWARQRGMAFWKPQIEQLLKEKRFDDAARAVMIASLVDPKDMTVASAGRRLEKEGVKPPAPPGDEPVLPLFPNRSRAGRMRAWSTLGAPFGRAERRIDDGNRYLLSTQGEKGIWDSEKSGGYRAYDTGITGLALLALLVDGPGGLVGDRAIGARRAADAIVGAQAEGGKFGSEKGSIYCTLFATEALAEYAAITGQVDRYRPTLERARDCIVDAQNPGAGWRYKARDGENDTSVTARAVCALHALERAGIKVPKSAMEGAMAWIDQMTEPEFGLIGYNYPGGACARLDGKQDTFPADHTAAMTAAGLLATCYVGGDRPWVPLSLACLSEVPPEKRYPDMYYWELGSRAYVAAAGDVPADWYAALVDAAVSCARPDGGIADCDAWQGEGGRIYATAMTVLALAAPFSEPPPRERGPSASGFLGDGVREVVVPAWTAEVPTGIYADQGMTLDVLPRGTIQPWVGSPKVAADGIKHDLKSYRPLVRGAPFACLLGKVGREGKPFRIQETKPVTFTACGQLYLLINDERPEDGSGQWTVRIRLER